MVVLYISKGKKLMAFSTEGTLHSQKTKTRFLQALEHNFTVIQQINLTLHSCLVRWNHGKKGRIGTSDLPVERKKNRQQID